MPDQWCSMSDLLGGPQGASEISHTCLVTLVVRILTLGLVGKAGKAVMMITGISVTSTSKKMEVQYVMSSGALDVCFVGVFAGKKFTNDVGTVEKTYVGAPDLTPQQASHERPQRPARTALQTIQSLT